MVCKTPGSKHKLDTVVPLHQNDLPPFISVKHCQKQGRTLKSMAVHHRRTSSIPNTGRHKVCLSSFSMESFHTIVLVEGNL